MGQTNLWRDASWTQERENRIPVVQPVGVSFSTERGRGDTYYLQNEERDTKRRGGRICLWPFIGGRKAGSQWYQATEKGEGNTN